jgi:hypothetical protein
VALPRAMRADRCSSAIWNWSAHVRAPSSNIESMADDEILRPRGTYLGGVVPPWPGPTTLRASVINVTINVTRITRTAKVTVTVNVAVST